MNNRDVLNVGFLIAGTSNPYPILNKYLVICRTLEELKEELEADIKIKFYRYDELRFYSNVKIEVPYLIDDLSNLSFDEAVEYFYEEKPHLIFSSSTFFNEKLLQRAIQYFNFGWFDVVSFYKRCTLKLVESTNQNEYYESTIIDVPTFSGPAINTIYDDTSELKFDEDARHKLRKTCNLNTDDVLYLWIGELERDFQPETFFHFINFNPNEKYLLLIPEYKDQRIKEYLNVFDIGAEAQIVNSSDQIDFSFFDIVILQNNEMFNNNFNFKDFLSASDVFITSSEGQKIYGLILDALITKSIIGISNKNFIYFINTDNPEISILDDYEFETNSSVVLDLNQTLPKIHNITNPVELQDRPFGQSIIKLNNKKYSDQLLEEINKSYFSRRENKLIFNNRNVIQNHESIVEQLHNLRFQIKVMVKSKLPYRWS